MSADSSGSQKRGSDALEMELEVVLSHPTRVTENELRSSVKASCTHTH